MMDRDQGNSQSRTGKHHHHVRSLTQMAEKFRVTRELKAMLMQVGFVNGAGDQGFDSSVQCRADRYFNVMNDRLCGSGGWLSVLNVMGSQLTGREKLYGADLVEGLRGIRALMDFEPHSQRINSTLQRQPVPDHNRPTLFLEIHLSKGFGNDFGSYPTRITHGNGDAGQ
jgi:hypothetical protein